MSADTLRIAAWYARTRLLRFRDRAALERYQRRRVAKHLRFLARRSPWYARLLPRPFAELPLMDKRTMMADFDDLVTVDVDRDEALALAIEAERTRRFDATLGGCSIGLSSGTSGHRGMFLTSATERAQWAGTMLAKTLPHLRGQRIALFLRAGGDLYDTVGSRAVRFEYFDTFEPVEQHLARLEGLSPTVLVGPPSVLRGIADEVSAGRLRIAPEKVYSVAEVLTPLDEARLREGLGVGVIHQIYQCTEGFLGCTCEHGTLHLNEDVVLVEREHLDERRFVPIVTDFMRRTQPIVRYRMGDVLLLRDDPCPCGSVFTALERIEGREDDVLHLASGEGGVVSVYPDLVARAVVYADGVEEYRVVQASPRLLRIHLEPLSPHVVESVTTELAALLEAQGAEGVTFDFQPYLHDPTRKLRRVERL
ncbi:hypothetical protein BW730_00410 [Tessaracoccus aquimaris]|uniref:CoF synthetase n=1 Tax=Tessaracoccus aquimaris TaxID=1332264 RepID=A0A1Q2CJP8_9ACTN|nr:F390 synthetase-related protein [Tessaracoccus aquimaris]AQP46265.1 hypothetical protein BW730_00410 [Tessaracoccus aquimaris]